MNTERLVEVSLALYDPHHCHRSFHICFLVCKNKIVSIGKNSLKTNPMNLRNPKYALDGTDISGTKSSCAEFDALMKLKKMTNIPFNKIKMYNIRLNKHKVLALAKPCMSCQSLMKFLGIREAWYTTNEGTFERL